MFPFRRSPWKKVAGAMYERLVDQARLPIFYDALDVPDTVKGRFSMIVLHAALVLNRLRRVGIAAGEGLPQELFDTMFADMESNLRELGYADATLGKRVKGMIAGFYGQVHAYEAGLHDADDQILSTALHRNLYATVSKDDLSVSIEKMVRYVRQQAVHLAAQDDAAFLSGFASFETPFL